MIELPMYDADAWQLRGTCARLGVDPDVMQPERATREEVAEAMELCNGCPVASLCWDHADSQRTTEGHCAAYGIHAGEWWGPEPTWETVTACEGCGVEVRSAGARRFCSSRCSSRERQRRRRAA